MSSVQKLSANGSQKREAAPVLRNWESARIFLEVARSGSFRAAAQGLNVSVNTLRRQIDELERQTGLKLFTRHADGLRMTKEAEQVLGAAKRMELAACDLVRGPDGYTSIRGEVRLSVTEGLASFWVAPHLVEFSRTYPDLLVELRSRMRPADVMRLESEVSIQIVPPTDKDLRVMKVGRMHGMPFASPTYLERYGRPKTVADFKKHRIVLQDAEQVDSMGFARLFPGISQIGMVSLRTNASTTHFWAVVAGAGIGVLPTYGADLRLLEPLDVGLEYAWDLWLVYHPDLAKTPRVRLLIDWLVELFSPRRFPCFSDEFIHPRDLPDHAGGLSLFGL
jgi:DNA-binding transcriptional LysR family regulator